MTKSDFGKPWVDIVLWIALIIVLFALVAVL
jgi:hypothetical protein